MRLGKVRGKQVPRGERGGGHTPQLLHAEPWGLSHDRPLMTLPAVTAQCGGEATARRDGKARRVRLPPGAGRRGPTLRAGADRGPSDSGPGPQTPKGPRGGAVPPPLVPTRSPSRSPDTRPAHSPFPGFPELPAFHLPTPSRGKRRALAATQEDVSRPLRPSEERESARSVAGAASYRRAVHAERAVHPLHKAPRPQRLPRSLLIGQLQGPALSRLSDSRPRSMSQWQWATICPFQHKAVHGTRTLLHILLKNDLTIDKGQAGPFWYLAISGGERSSLRSLTRTHLVL